MSSKKKKNRSIPKDGNVVFRMSSEEATLAHKPHYNGYASGYGVHGDVKYNRAREKRNWKNELCE